jgi:hypothetical protein
MKIDKSLPRNIMFGQYLLQIGKTDKKTLFGALNVQAAENNNILRGSHRLLGEILLDDFKVFRNRQDLQTCLADFVRGRKQE